MPTAPRPRRRALAAALASLVLGLAPRAGAQAPVVDPFAPGLRWTSAAPLDDPWIPCSVVLGAEDQLAWSAAEGAGGRLALHPVQGAGVAAPRFEDRGVAPAVGSLAVASPAHGRALFAVAQYPLPGQLARRTELTRHDAVGAAEGLGFAPVWSHALPFDTNGPARVATDAMGDVLVAAAWHDAGRTLHMEWIDGASGGVLASAQVPAASLQALALSADGSRAAVVAGTQLHVFDALGTLLFTEPLGATTTALAIRADGRRVFAGGPERLLVLSETAGGAFNTDTPVTGELGELLVRVACAPEGDALGLAWWNAAGGAATRFELRAGPLWQLEREHVQQGAPGGLQNVPQAAVASADGRRFGFATWGKGDADPEVLVLDRDQPGLAFAADLPGSAMALAMDASGTRLAVATKNLHANQLGTTGELRLYDTGERDLALREPPRVGGHLSMSARMAGATSAFFLVGRRRAELPFGPSGGALAIDRGRRMRVFAAGTDASGRADLTLDLPDASALIGRELSVQAALRVNGRFRFTETVVDPLIL